MSPTMPLERMESASNTRELLTLNVGEQIFGIPILQVQDVLGPQKITRVPLAPTAIAGSLNLRGRIVTAINMRACLGMAESDADARTMSVVVENQGELYSLMIDRVGDVMNLPYSDFEKNPATLNPQWRALCQGIYRLKDKLLVVLDVPRLLEGLQPQE
jgi:purine-binding chemotaxis protein CheW